MGSLKPFSENFSSHAVVFPLAAFGGCVFLVRWSGMSKCFNVYRSISSPPNTWNLEQLEQNKGTVELPNLGPPNLLTKRGMILKHLQLSMLNQVPNWNSRNDRMHGDLHPYFGRTRKMAWPLSSRHQTHPDTRHTRGAEERMVQCFVGLLRRCTVTWQWRSSGRGNQMSWKINPVICIK